MSICTGQKEYSTADRTLDLDYKQPTHRFGVAILLQYEHLPDCIITEVKYRIGNQARRPSEEDKWEQDSHVAVQRIGKERQKQRSMSQLAAPPLMKASPLMAVGNYVGKRIKAHMPLLDDRHSSGSTPLSP